MLHCLRLRDVDSQEKAVVALKYLYAAGLIAATPAAPANSTAAEVVVDDESSRECRRHGVPDELARLLRLCDEAAAAAGGDLNCEDLRPMLRQLSEQLSGGAPAVRIRQSDTVFHIEV